MAAASAPAGPSAQTLTDLSADAVATQLSLALAATDRIAASCRRFAKTSFPVAASVTRTQPRIDPAARPASAARAARAGGAARGARRGTMSAPDRSNFPSVENATESTGHPCFDTVCVTFPDATCALAAMVSGDARSRHCCERGVRGTGAHAENFSGLVVRCCRDELAVAGEADAADATRVLAEIGQLTASPCI